MPMTHIPEIGAENRARKPVPQISTKTEKTVVLLVTGNYEENSVPNCMSGAPETGTGF